MYISDDLLIKLDGLGIDTACDPETLKQRVADLYSETREHTFGWLEEMESTNKVFETVYGMEHFILVKNLHKAFMKEYYGERIYKLKRRAHAHKTQSLEDERQGDR